jgi:hypothetical protein
VAYLPSKAIDDGAGPVDQSLTAQFVPSAHNSLRTSRRDNLSRRPAIMAASPPSLGLRYHGRLGGLIHEFDQVPSCGSPIRHPHVLRAEYLHHSPLVENAFGAQVRALLRQLEATVINAEELAAATVAHFEKHPDAEIVTSLQGLRSLPAPRCSPRSVMTDPVAPTPDRSRHPMPNARQESAEPPACDRHTVEVFRLMITFTNLRCWRLWCWRGSAGPRSRTVDRCCGRCRGDDGVMIIELVSGHRVCLAVMPWMWQQRCGRALPRRRPTGCAPSSRCVADGAEVG